MDAPSGHPQVWLADLDKLGNDLERLEAAAGLLAPSERAWATPALRQARARRRLARIALRLLLHRAGASGARGLELEVDGHGKPRLGGDGPAFNASHSGGLALFALSPVGPVGIDLELTRPVALAGERRAQIVAAGRAISPTAAADAPAAAGDAASFLRAWTCLEAFGKARGSGIGALLTDLAITASGVRRSTPAEVAGRAAALAAASGLSVVGLALPQGCHGALAMPRGLLTAPPPVRSLGPDECRAA